MAFLTDKNWNARLYCTWQFTERYVTRILHRDTVCAWSICDWTWKRNLVQKYRTLLLYSYHATIGDEFSFHTHMHTQHATVHALSQKQKHRKNWSVWYSKKRIHHQQQKGKKSLKKNENYNRSLSQSAGHSDYLLLKACRCDQRRQKVPEIATNIIVDIIVIVEIIVIVFRSGGGSWKQIKKESCNKRMRRWRRFVFPSYQNR